jgi:hypothetical protein
MSKPNPTLREMRRLSDEEFIRGLHDAAPDGGQGIVSDVTMAARLDKPQDDQAGEARR